MAFRAAVANGNWSSTSTWNGGVLPAAGDVVASNGFTVTIDQNVNVDSITNAATTVTTAIPTMTSNTAPSGIASSSGTGGFSSYPAYYAFNGDVSNVCYAGTTIVGDWIAYEFTSPKKIGQFSIRFNGVTVSINFSLDAWDGTNWITIGTYNTSGGATSTMFANTTAYIKYRIQFLSGGVYTQINEFYMFESLSVAAVAGGTFTLNSGVTVTCTGGGINIGGTTCLTYAGSGSATINANIGGLTSVSITGIIHSGTGTLSINGDVVGSTITTNNTVVSVTSTGILNVTGNVTGFGSSSANGIRMASGSILNLIGNITVSNTIKNVVSLLAGSTLNMTGNATCQFNNANSGVCIDANAATVNITGNLSVTNSNSSSNVNWYCLAAANICTINITGTISNDTTSNAMAFSYPVIISGASYYNHVGAVIGGLRAPAVYNTVVGAINIMTGPFISHSSGIQPFYLARMHYRRTMGSYFEFRDNSTNGALPPAGAAPATRLVSPDTVADAPIPANVRKGVIYALGSQTGTMTVPDSSNVVKNVPVDNTVGTGVLDPSAIWNVPLAYINTPNSIGKRVKNAATVETTGAQIQTTLNNNV